MHRPQSLAIFMAVIAVITVISACHLPNSQGMLATGVTITPSPDTLAAGSAPATFAITVTNDKAGDTPTAGLTLPSNGACTTAVCGSLGAVSAGTIANGTGLYNVVYTPPATVSVTQTITLTVSAQGQSSTLGSGMDTITIPLPVVTVAPPSPNINAGSAASTFTISVTNDSSADMVTPTLSLTGGGACTAASCGSLGKISSGVITNGTGSYTVAYTPPASVTAITKITLTATSSLTPAPGTAAITIATPGAPVVSIAPTSLAVTAGDSTQPSFAISVTNDVLGDAITPTLTVNGTSCLPAACGSLGGVTGTSGGGAYAVKYMIPASVSAPMAVTLTASSPLAGSVSGTSTITVSPPSVVRVSAIPAQIAGGGAVTVHASVSYDSASDVLTPALTISGGTCSTTTHNCGTLGSVSTGGVTNGTGAYTFSYTPPVSLTASEAVTLTVSSTQLLSTPGTATINLTPAPVITISPLTKTVTAGISSTSFNLSITNDVATEGLTPTLSQGGVACGLLCGGGVGITGTAGGGSYTVTYTPPVTVASPIIVTLTVSSNVPGSTPGSTTITVNPKSVITVSPPAPSVAAGSAQMLFNITVPYDVPGGDSLTAVLTTAGGSCSTTTNNCGTLTAVSAGIITNGTGAYTVGYTPPTTIGATTVYTLTVNSSIALSTPGTATITVGAATGNVPRYLLEVNGDSTISSYAVVPSNGQLRSVTYFSANNGLTMIPSAAIHPNGAVIYTVQTMSIGEQLVSYSISPGGVLSQLATSPVSGLDYGQLLVDPLGRFLWVVDTVNQQIASYALDSSTGAQGTKTIAASVTSVTQIAADPSGNYLFARDNSGSVSAYSVTGTGTLTALGTPPASHPSPFSGGSMTVTPSGKYLFALDGSSINSIYTYSISSAGLTAVSPSSFLIPNSGGADTQMVVDPSSSFLYAVDTSSPTHPIDAFTIGAGGALASLPVTLQVPSSVNAAQISIDPAGSYVYLDYGSAHEVWTYSIVQSGTSRGTLVSAPVGRIRTRSSGVNAQLLSTGSAPVTFTPQALYVSNSQSNNIAQFSIAPSTGSLTSLGPVFTGGSGDQIGMQPEGLAVFLGGSLLYSGDYSSGQIDSLGILTGGSLGSSGLSAVSVAPETPASLTTDLSGSFLYIADKLNGDLGKLPIGAGGTLGTTASTTTSNPTSAPVFVTTDPTGQFIYSANNSTNTISQFKIALPSGNLTSIASDIGALGLGPDWIAIDPSGRFLYSADKTTSGGGNLGAFTISASTGSLAATGVQAAGTTPSAAVIEPTGQYIFVADSTSNQIFSFTINPSTGALTANTIAVPAATTGTTPVALGVDISGQYLYCINSGSNDISIFKINLTNGTLSPVGTTVSTGGTTPIGLAITGTLQ